MKYFSRISVFSVAILVASLASWSFNVSAKMPILKGIGGDFTLASSNGHDVSLSDFKEKVVLIFFGYTNCADICPTTVAHINQMMKKLTAVQRAKVQVLFISFDSEYDTPKHLNKYLNYFNPSFIGLVDVQEKVNQVAKLYHAEFSKLADEKVTVEYKKLSVEDKDTAQRKGYLYSHSAKIFVIDRKSRVRGFFYTGTPLTDMRDQVVELLNN
ncbi:MAG: SCO family protein [Oceanospirillaceae bacterium]